MLEAPDISYTRWLIAILMCTIGDTVQEAAEICGTYEDASAEDPGEAEALAAARD